MMTIKSDGGYVLDVRPSFLV
ncbi:hypothetical protein, partial [Kingella kingae]